MTKKKNLLPTRQQSSRRYKRECPTALSEPGCRHLDVQVTRNVISDQISISLPGVHELFKAVTIIEGRKGQCLSPVEYLLRQIYWLRFHFTSTYGVRWLRRQASTVPARLVHFPDSAFCVRSVSSGGCTGHFHRQHGASVFPQEERHPTEGAYVLVLCRRWSDWLTYRDVSRTGACGLPHIGLRNLPGGTRRPQNSTWHGDNHCIPAGPANVRKSIRRDITSSRFQAARHETTRRGLHGYRCGLLRGFLGVESFRTSPPSHYVRSGGLLPRDIHPLSPGNVLRGGVGGVTSPHPQAVLRIVPAECCQYFRLPALDSIGRHSFDRDRRAPFHSHEPLAHCHAPRVYFALCGGPAHHSKPIQAASHDPRAPVESRHCGVHLGRCSISQVFVGSADLCVEHAETLTWGYILKDYAELRPIRRGLSAVHFARFSIQTVKYSKLLHDIQSCNVETWQLLSENNSHHVQKVTVARRSVAWIVFQSLCGWDR